MQKFDSGANSAGEEVLGCPENGMRAPETQECATKSEVGLHGGDLVRCVGELLAAASRRSEMLQTVALRLEGGGEGLFQGGEVFGGGGPAGDEAHDSACVVVALPEAETHMLGQSLHLGVL